MIFPIGPIAGASTASARKAARQSIFASPVEADGRPSRRVVRECQVQRLTGQVSPHEGSQNACTKTANGCNGYPSLKTAVQGLAVRIVCGRKLHWVPVCKIHSTTSNTCRPGSAVSPSASLSRLIGNVVANLLPLLVAHLYRRHASKICNRLYRDRSFLSFSAHRTRLVSRTIGVALHPVLVPRFRLAPTVPSAVYVSL